MNKITIYTFIALLTATTFNIKNCYAAGSQTPGCDASKIEETEREVIYQDVITQPDTIGKGFIIKDEIKLTETVSCGTLATFTLDNSFQVLGPDLEVLNVMLVSSSDSTGGVSTRRLLASNSFVSASGDSWVGREISFPISSNRTYKLLFNTRVQSEDSAVINLLNSSSFEFKQH